MTLAGRFLLIFGLLAQPVAALGQTLLADAAGGPVRSLPSAPSPASCLQSRDEAWWTGPMMANSAETLTPGHFLFEPYFYEVRAPRWSLSGSSAYVLYGLANDLTAGVIPVVGAQRIDGNGSSSLALGDIALSAQYRLRRFHEGSWLPTVALNLQQTLPTGKYDRLGNRPADGLGNGVYATMVSLNSQTYFWMRNGRILRTRLDLSQTYANDRASIEGVSVYGTDGAFRGHAKPGGTFLADLAFEYSLTQRWVVALDLLYSRQGSTSVAGFELPAFGGVSGTAIATQSGPRESYGFAPAIEWNLNASLGVLLGTRVIRDLRNSTNTITPALAINYVH